MIKIRLRRMGAKKRPFYRIVAAEHSMRRDGRFIENLGHYDPLAEPPIINVNAERVQHWLSVGAKPSETVESLLKKAGAIPADAEYNKPRVRPAAPQTESAPTEEAPAEDEATDETGAESAAVETATEDVEVVESAEDVPAEETPVEPSPAKDLDPVEGADESANQE